MFKVIICDDNKEFAEYEKNILESIMNDVGVRQRRIILYESGLNLLEHQKELGDCNLLLMDVEMDGKNGIEVLNEIRNTQNIVIVIISSFIDYAPEGYVVNAFRYLLKTSNNLEEGLREVVEYAIKIKNAQSTNTITIEFREKKFSFGVNDLVYVESKLHYAYFHIITDRGIEIYSLRKTLDAIEEWIMDKNLIRIHKSQLVNLRFIVDVRRYEAMLTTGEVLTIAQGRYDTVMIKYARYVGGNHG